MFSQRWYLDVFKRYLATLSVGWGYTSRQVWMNKSGAFVECYWRAKPKFSGRKLPQCQFVHHKTHVKRPRTEKEFRRSDYLLESPYGFSESWSISSFFLRNVWNHNSLKLKRFHLQKLITPQTPDGGPLFLWQQSSNPSRYWPLSPAYILTIYRVSLKDSSGFKQLYIR
jgi:hypothetical protein